MNNVPSILKDSLKWVLNLPDYFQRLKHKQTVIPPVYLRRAGGGIKGYLEGGHQQKDWLIRQVGLNPDSRILDIGCGDGRLASALLSFLKEGSYSTFEVNEKYVKYLKSAISEKNRNFIFKHADLWHSYYNPMGKHKTLDYIFPFDNNMFDIAFLNSIFTHFMPNEITHYLPEIQRVLKLDGVIFATYFIVNKESMDMDSRGLSEDSVKVSAKKILNHKIDNYWVRDIDVKEHIVGIDEEWLKNEYKKSGFQVTKIIYGTWCGRKKTEDNTQQDIVIAKKLNIPTL